MTSNKTKGTPNEMDVHVGQRLKVRRSLLGLSQEQLANAVNLTFQQIQKYERGANRISAGRLFDFSKILDVPIGYFFDQYGFSSTNANLVSGLSDNEQDDFQSEDANIMDSKETLEVLRAYYSVKDPVERKNLLKLIKSMASKL